MAYEVREAGNSFKVVLTINSGKTVVRTLNTYSVRADAERLVADLAGWVF